MVQWNDAQKKAIYTKDKNILISASAGAGKTTVLIARLMHLIKDEGIGVDEILAMTFSEAAAMEMKKRLAKSLHDELTVSENPQYIQTQLANLDSANISTIHGFCLNIIKEYYYMADLSKERINHPMDELQAGTLKKQAMKQAMDKAYQNDEFARFSLHFTSRPETGGSLEGEIESLSNLANSKADPVAFLNSCRLNYQPIEKIAEVNPEIFHYFLDSFKVPLNLLIDLGKKTILEMEDDILQPKVDHYIQAFTCLENEDYATFREHFKVGMKVKLPAESKATYIKEIADKEKGILNLLFEEKDYVFYHNQLVEDIHFFISITSDYLKAYEQLKINEGVIDFNDMEQYAIQILKADGGYVANLYRKKFRSIMVDEFQDSNDVQDELVKLIARENNIFRVGDIKQSIYGFRHALPSIMRGLMEQPQEQDEVIFLSYNYRSTKTIVDFNNILFDRLMNLDELSSSYLEEDKVATGTPKQEEVAIPVMMHLIDKKEVDVDGEYTSAELKASYIANQIQEHIKQGYSYRDMVILVRSNARMEEIKEALDEVNIPCFYNKKQGFYDSKSVQTIISYLKALVNPYDDLQFVSILTSELYQFDVNDLAKAQLERDKTSYVNYYKEDARLESFFALRKQLYSSKLSELLQTIYNINDYYMEYQSVQERANLDMLYEMVCAYEKDEALSINGFLNYLENQKGLEIGEAMPIGANDDVVRIMSIHKSKGLQFRVVFLYSSNSFGIQASEGVTSVDEELKLGMKYLDLKQLVRYPTITSLAIRQKQLQEYLEEEQRLLYVATTRAQEVLHIVDVGKDSSVEEYSINEFYKLKGYTGWIQKAFAIEPSPLFEYRYVNEMWESEVMEQQVQTYQFKPYQGTVSEVGFLSPSDTEMKITKPQEFTMQEDLGFERGTNLHRMVEVLPPTEWNESLLDEVASKEMIALDAHDKTVLLALRNQPLFEKALQYQHVYYEYAFMVKMDDGIMHGFMDFLAVDTQDVIMIDFKSDRSVDESVLLERYRSQIDAYYDALIRMYKNHKVSTYIYSFELKKMIKLN